MRLTEEQVRRGLQHADRHVRFAAMRYFADSHSTNTAIMGDVIEVIERLGPVKAFAYTFPIAGLAQSEPTIGWVVERLQQVPTNEAERNFAYHLGQLLCHADPALVRPRKEAVLQSPGLEESAAARLERRLELAATEADKLWQTLEQLCQAGAENRHPDEFPYSEAEDIAEALARDVSQADRMMELLNREFDPETEPASSWLEIFLVRMAGDMRYEPAVVPLVRKLHIDGEVLNEQCNRALIKIGTDGVVQAVREARPQAPHHFRLYSNGVFGGIRTDLAVSAGLEILATEPDRYLREWLATYLLDQFSTEVVDTVRMLRQAGEFRSQDLTTGLVIACKLMDYPVPESKAWERELAERRSPPIREVPRALPIDDIDAGTGDSPIASLKKAGRNDPCPCGSGKKYKKCCLNR